VAALGLAGGGFCERVELLRNTPIFGGLNAVVLDRITEDGAAVGRTHHLFGS